MTFRKLVCFAVLTIILSFNADAQKIKCGITEETGALGKRNDFDKSSLAEFFRAENIDATLFTSVLSYNKDCYAHRSSDTVARWLAVLLFLSLLLPDEWWTSTF